MASRLRSEIAIFVIVFLILSPVLAVPENASVPGGVTVSAGAQKVPYTITLFIPSSHQVHSDQVKDQINGPNGEVIIATASGLSTFNGTWSTGHINRDNISQGLMDDYITAVEFDHQGNLWLGYSGGIQIYNGIYYQSIREQDLLGETRINDLQRWDNDMWVATGHAGIHRYRDGEWTWFQPMTKNGPGFYEIDSMALDSAGNSLVIATADEGLWIVHSSEDLVHFDQIAGKDEVFGRMQHVRRDPLGGVYFFNQTAIVHFDNVSGFTGILTTGDFTVEQIAINDIAAGSDGSLYVATDDGIYIWRDGAMYRNLNRVEGIGTSEIVRTVNVDAENRVWFSTQGYVGYYFDTSNSYEPIQIDLVTPTATPTPVIIVNDTRIQANRSVDAVILPSPTPVSVTNIFSQIADPILRAIDAVAQKFGVKFFSLMSARA